MKLGKRTFYVLMLLLGLVALIFVGVYSYSPPMVADPYEPCDNDRDGDCDRADYQLVTQAIGQCEDGNYNELADADHDGCVTAIDRQQLFPTIPEK